MTGFLVNTEHVGIWLLRLFVCSTDNHTNVLVRVWVTPAYGLVLGVAAGVRAGDARD